MESSLPEFLTECVKENVPDKNSYFQYIKQKVVGDQNKINNKFNSVRNRWLSQVCIHCS